MFNFNISDVKPSTSSKYLKPYNIYNNVTLSRVETKEGVGKTGNPWKSMIITFACEEGEFSKSMFYVKTAKDCQRGSMDMPNNGKRELPSAWERNRDLMAAIGFAFFPEDFAKLQEAVAKNNSFKNEEEGFEFIASCFIKCINKNLGKNPTSMKLVGRNSNGTVYAELPSCTGIAEAKDEKRASDNNVNVGEWYTWMVSPFGDNLTFSTYEERQKIAYESAKPTPIKDETSEIIQETTSEGSEEIDFDSLL